VPATQRGDELGEVARALEHFRLTAQEKERLQKQEEAELDFAHTVQLAGLPRHAPVLANGDTVDIRGVLVPSRAVSGDFLDYYQMDANRLAVTIGDASGKGVSSAMFAGWVLGTLKSESMRTANPGQCLTATNRRVAADNDSMMFVTTFFGVIDFADGLFSYANAGHVLPYLLSNAGGVRALVADPGLPLGVVEAFDFEWRQTRLEPGDTIVLYTDGVTEAAAVSDEMFGQQRLEDFLSSHRDADCRFLVDTLLEAVQNFARGAPQADDITVLAVRYKDAPQTIVRSA
jgi:sigma-B regulation protein RsbU (phosphoserine phosphatase)